MSGWLHPAECSNVHDEGGNCLDAGSGMIVGWREVVDDAGLRVAAKRVVDVLRTWDFLDQSHSTMEIAVAVGQLRSVLEARSGGA